MQAIKHEVYLEMLTYAAGNKKAVLTTSKRFDIEEKLIRLLIGGSALSGKSNSGFTVPELMLLLCFAESNKAWLYAGIKTLEVDYQLIKKSGVTSSNLGKKASIYQINPSGLEVINHFLGVLSNVSYEINPLIGCGVDHYW